MMLIVTETANSIVLSCYSYHIIILFTCLYIHIVLSTSEEWLHTVSMHYRASNEQCQIALNFCRQLHSDTK